MAIRFLIALFAGKLTRLLFKLLGREGGTWPGEIALRIDPTILRHFSEQFQAKGGSTIRQLADGMTDKRIILIAGTNGKTTTAKMIETILRENGKSVFHNESGANLDNGIVSSFLKASDWRGKVQADYCIFEVDEAMLPKIVESVQCPAERDLASPEKVESESKNNSSLIIVLLNLFRDQLDRYGEVDTIAEKWLEALTRHAELDFSSALRRIPGQARNDESYSTVVINADDPHLAFIGSKLSGSVAYFGLDDTSLYSTKIEHATDSIYCPNCGGRLTFGGVYFAHLGKWSCGNCGFTHPKVALSGKDVSSPLSGLYNRYNAMAAALVCRSLGMNLVDIQSCLKHFRPAFGRQETIEKNGKKIKILLSKNPVGFNESLRTALSEGAKHFFFVLNDRIPDGRDVSWIWDVDFEMLRQDKPIITISGDRMFDLALRLKYAGLPVSQTKVYRSLEESIGAALEAAPSDEYLWILPTYSAMLEVRQLLTGKKIL